jgi:mannose-6-phosphate isomerase-like protein (cupin superfamily)
MMNVRRVITGPTAEYESDVVIDGAPTRVIASTDGGPETALIWTTPGIPVVPINAGDPSVDLDLAEIFPAPGGTRFLIVDHPPGSGVVGGFGGTEQEAAELGLDESGMHATESVDFLVVLSGQVWLELDAGKEIVLSAGDALVQNGTRHGWRNRGTEAARVAITLVGAHRTRS